MAIKTKKTAAIAAGVLSAALLLGGTFAWTSLDQEAKNESTGIVNVGGRLHDDFNGTNKDVYVENFTDPTDGGQPIYARIRLDEYMEVGPEAGDLDNPDRNATPIVEGMDADDENTWKTHIPNAEGVTLCDTTCAFPAGCTLHTHWEWQMGGETVYMPTFNKDKDSIAADENGHYHGTDWLEEEKDKVYYDDYVVYTTEAGGIVVDVINKTATDQAGIPLKDGQGTDISFGSDVLTAVDGEIYSVTDYAYYDDDANPDPNDHVNGIGVRKEEETHTAKETVSADVITMEEWKKAEAAGGKGGKPGNYWVYDTDGWAYWGNPIMPGESTGLLLDGITMLKNPGDKCYYAINVTAEFATIGDWTSFTPGEKGEFNAENNADALALLEAAADSIPEMTITIQGTPNQTAYLPNSSVAFEAKLELNGEDITANAGEITWEVVNEEAASVLNGNVLSVGNETVEANKIITVAARAANYPGLVGMKSIAVLDHPEIGITYNGEEEFSADMIYPGAELEIALDLEEYIAAYGDADVAWSQAGEGMSAPVPAEDFSYTITFDESLASPTVFTLSATLTPADSSFAPSEVEVLDFTYYVVLYTLAVVNETGYEDLEYPYNNYPTWDEYACMATLHSYELEFRVNGLAVEDEITWSVEQIACYPYYLTQSLSADTKFAGNTLTIAAGDKTDSYWKVIRITGVDEAGNVASLRVLLSDVGCTHETLLFLDENGAAVGPSEYAPLRTIKFYTGKTYDVQLDTTASAHPMGEYLDPIFLTEEQIGLVQFFCDDEDVTAEVWQNGKFTPKEAGEYHVTASSNEINFYPNQYITVEERYTLTPNYSNDLRENTLNIPLLPSDLGVGLNFTAEGEYVAPAQWSFPDDKITMESYGGVRMKSG